MDPFKDFVHRLVTGTWPPVTQRTAVVAWVASFAVIVGLYAAKALLLRAGTRAGDAALLFACLLAFCVPLTWVVSPDWENRHVLKPAIYVGGPVMTLTVPTLSFAYDVIRRSSSAPPSWAWRVPIEVLVAAPVWAFVWVFVELLLLGWIWI